MSARRMNYLASLQGDGMPIGMDAAKIIQGYAVADCDATTYDDIVWKGLTIFHLDARQIYNLPRAACEDEVHSLLLDAKDNFADWCEGYEEKIGGDVMSGYQLNYLSKHAFYSYDKSLPNDVRFFSPPEDVVDEARDALWDIGYGLVQSYYRAYNPDDWLAQLQRTVTMTLIGRSQIYDLSCRGECEAKGKRCDRGCAGHRNMVSGAITIMASSDDDTDIEACRQLDLPHLNSMTMEDVVVWQMEIDAVCKPYVYPCKFRRQVEVEPTDLTWLHTPDG